MLNTREKSEMQSRLAANVCKIEHSVPSRSVESEAENVLNTLSPGRCSRWILPEELATPNRPTSSGLQSPTGAPGDVPAGHDMNIMGNPSESGEHQDELDNVAAMHDSEAMAVLYQVPDVSMAF